MAVRQGRKIRRKIEMEQLKGKMLVTKMEPMHHQEIVPFLILTQRMKLLPSTNNLDHSSHL